ncbi:MAG: squalene synthase HpnC [Burkholderiales bacterium]
MPVAHYENFPVASLLLPARLRPPVEEIYRFARSADDVADEGDDPPAARLAKLEACRGEIEPIARTHGLPREPFADLLDAFSQDVVKTRYASYAELLDYCRRSANPVGRLLLHLFKRTSATDLAQSDAICTSLQLVNFWQDVALDYAKGRIYLPLDEVAAHGVTEAHLAEARCDEAWRALMAFQVRRTRALMLTGAPLGRSLTGRIGLEIRATVQGGLRILERIERAGYDVFRRRPELRWHDWPVILARAI